MTEIIYTKNAILGKGQVANAIKTYLPDSEMYDKGEWEFNGVLECKILHIAIPYSDDFVYIAHKAIKSFNPKYLVIHSTVRPYTTMRIEFDKKLYSPVNGRHDDNFQENIGFYKKFFAGKKEIFDEIKNDFNFDSEFFSDNTTELEYAKIMCTSYMYWNLMYQKIIQKDCKKNGMNFDKVYKVWNENYNKGLSVKHPEWQRPIYEWNDNSIAGGHCLSPNLKLTSNFITDTLQAWERFQGRLTGVYFDNFSADI